MLKSEIKRFLVVGIGSNILNYLAYYLIFITGFSIIVASAIGYLVGVFNSYYFGSTWVFCEKGKINLMSFLIFIGVYLIGGAGMVLIIDFTYSILLLDYRMCWLLGAIFAVINNYIGSKFLVFK